MKLYPHTISYFFRIILVITFFCWYITVQKHYDIRYYDEAWWIGDSFFFDLVLQNRSSPIWNTDYPYDQPKLVHYLFGASLYPEYVKSHRQHGDTNYFSFLEKNHFLTFNDPQTLQDPVRVIGQREFEKNISSPTYASTRMIIRHIRLLNAAFAAATLFFIYAIGKNMLGAGWAYVFMIWYGANGLIMRTTLLAHAEGIFLFFFSAALYALLKEKKHVTFINLGFGIFAGLAASSKLIGFVLIPLFWLYKLGESYVSQKKNIFLHIVVKSTVISVIVYLTFLFLHPFLYTKPIGGFIKMFTYRSEVQLYSASAAVSDAIPNFGGRIYSIIYRFFGPLAHDFNGPVLLNFLPWPVGLTYAITFCIGAWDFIRKKKYGIAFMYVFLLISHSVWLAVNWERYYVLMVLPTILLEVAGWRVIVNSIMSQRSHTLQRLT